LTIESLAAKSCAGGTLKKQRAKHKKPVKNLSIGFAILCLLHLVKPLIFPLLSHRQSTARTFSSSIFHKSLTAKPMSGFFWRHRFIIQKIVLLL